MRQTVSHTDIALGWVVVLVLRKERPDKQIAETGNTYNNFVLLLMGGGRDDEDLLVIVG